MYTDLHYESHYWQTMIMMMVTLPIITVAMYQNRGYLHTKLILLAAQMPRCEKEENKCANPFTTDHDHHNHQYERHRRPHHLPRLRLRGAWLTIDFRITIILIITVCFYILHTRNSIHSNSTFQEGHAYYMSFLGKFKSLSLFIIILTPLPFYFHYGQLSVSQVVATS